MLKQKKFTTQQRLGRLEKVVSQNFFLNKEIQKELKHLRDEINLLKGDAGEKE
jgi:hypothetical protein